MDAAFLFGMVFVVSLCYGIVALAVLLNLGVLPPPEPDQVAAHLYWRKPAQKVPLQRLMVTLTPSTGTVTLSSSTGSVSSKFTLTATAVSLAVIPVVIGVVEFARANEPRQRSSSANYVFVS